MPWSKLSPAMGTQPGHAYSLIAHAVSLAVCCCCIRDDGPADWAEQTQSDFLVCQQCCIMDDKACTDKQFALLQAGVCWAGQEQPAAQACGCGLVLSALPHLCHPELHPRYELACQPCALVPPESGPLILRAELLLQSVTGRQ